MAVIEHRFAELFCGPGGIGLGAALSQVRDSAGNIHKLKPVWANDIDQSACDTYIYNHLKNNPGAVVCAPIQDVDMTKIPDFEGLTFGFPCNDFSLVGEQKGIHGKYGGLYAYGAKLLEMRNPRWFIAENVSGLKSANDGETFKLILEDLKRCGKFGYNVVVNLYKFEEYGVPQNRHRIIMVGIRKDLKMVFKLPSQNTRNSPVSVKYALENPPIFPDAYNNELTKQSEIVVERLRFTPEGKNAWYIDDMLRMKDSELKKCLLQLPCLSKEELVKYSNLKLLREHLQELRLDVKSARLSQIYRRLDEKLPSYTMTGSGGGGTHGYHWKEPRALTNRERARIQTFTDDYIFLGSKESVRKQIGMAVPPKGIKMIFEALMKTLNDISYNFVEPKI